jgi:hypothetical protein
MYRIRQKSGARIDQSCFQSSNRREGIEMLSRTTNAKWLCALAAFVAIGAMSTKSAMAQRPVALQPAVQVAADSPANVFRTADLRTADSGIVNTNGGAVQVQQVRWNGRGYGYGYGGYARGYGYAPARAYYPNRYYSSYSPYPYYYGTPYNSYYAAPYNSYYAAPYYTNYRFPNYGVYGPGVAVRTYGGWSW